MNGLQHVAAIRTRSEGGPDQARARSAEFFALHKFSLDRALRQAYFVIVQCSKNSGGGWRG
jgi:hypothetical protein